MLLDIKIGDRQMRPTETEQKWAGAGAGALVLGLVTGSGLLKAGGALLLAGVAWSVYEEAALFAAPVAMNAYFKTDGKLSAMNGPAQAAALEGLSRTNRNRAPQLVRTKQPRPRRGVR